MARVTIDELPEETIPTGAEFLVIQDGATTKKMRVDVIDQSGLTTRVDALEDADILLDTRIDTNTANIAAHTSDIAALNTAANTLDSRVDTHDTTLGTHNTRLNGHDTTLGTQATTIGTHTTQIAGLNTAINDNESGLTALDNRVETLEEAPPNQGPPGPGVVAGGVTGQVLAKQSNVDYATQWINPPTGGGGGGIDAEAAVDAVGNAMIGLNGITVFYDDPGNSIQVNGTGLATTAAVALKADKSVTLTPTAPLTGGGDHSANRTIAISDFTATSRGAVPNPTASSGRFLRDDGQWMDIPATGGSLQSIWNWIAAATSSAVAAGKIGVNHDNPGSATQVWINRIGGLNGIDWTPTISTLVAGDYVYLQTKADASSFHHYRVTGVPVLNTNTYMIPVATSAGSPVGTEPPGNADVLVAFEKAPTGLVANGGGVATIQALTQAAYDAIGTKVATTLYVIIP